LDKGTTTKTQRLHIWFCSGEANGVTGHRYLAFALIWRFIAADSEHASKPTTVVS
jgi:hypothetical protein